MLSLYIHIPFCANKCIYCSFNSIPINSIPNLPAGRQGSQLIINNYVDQVCKEIQHYSEIFPNEEIKSIYFGGGTPSKIGAENIIKIIEEINQIRNLENLVELSIELNPYPEDEIFHFVKTISKKYDKFSRVRFSRGIQSLDNNVLSDVGRPYTFAGVADFLRWLREIKQENNIFNFDFIAFGKFNVEKNGNKKLWDDVRLNFFKNFAESWMADSFSIYTLEWIKSEAWRVTSYEKWKNHLLSSAKKSSVIFYWNDDEIYEEFEILKGMVLDAWYQRYELSNFAKLGKNSIHNMVYRNMENYIGIGVSASSFINCHSEAKLKNINLYPSLCSGWQSLRWTNTDSIDEYIKWNRNDKSKIIKLTEKDFLIEKFFLRMRTNEWIQNLNEFKNVLIPNYEEQIADYEKNWFLKIDWKKIKLTDKWMDVYNSIITELLKEI